MAIRKRRWWIERRWPGVWGNGNQKEEMVDWKRLARRGGIWQSKRRDGGLKEIELGNGKMAIKKRRWWIERRWLGVRGNGNEKEKMVDWKRLARGMGRWQ